MKTLTKLALAAVLAVGVLSTFSPEASAKGHHNHHGSSHHGGNHYKKHHKHHRGRHHRKYDFVYGFGGFAPSKSTRIIYIPVELGFVGVQ